MPDIFVPEDTVGYTGYYIDAINQGLIQKYARNVANQYRPFLKDPKSLDALLRLLPRDNTLLNNFVTYAAANGLPARWYYINLSRNLLINQIKANIARDLVGFQAFIQVLNEEDPTLKNALRYLQQGKSPINLKP